MAMSVDSCAVRLEANEYLWIESEFNFNRRPSANFLAVTIKPSTQKYSGHSTGIYCFTELKRICGIIFPYYVFFFIHICIYVSLAVWLWYIFSIKYNKSSSTLAKYTFSIWKLLCIMRFLCVGRLSVILILRTVFDIFLFCIVYDELQTRLPARKVYLILFFLFSLMLCVELLI